MNLIDAQSSPPEYPAHYGAADRVSGKAQRLFLRLTKLRLSALLIVAASPVLGFAGTWATLVPAAALVVALAVQLGLLQLRPESNWYLGRAVAESIKTLSWRYRMKVPPFDRGDDDSRTTLLSRIEEVAGSFPDLDFGPAEHDQIPDEMTRARE